MKERFLLCVSSLKCCGMIAALLAVCSLFAPLSYAVSDMVNPNDSVRIIFLGTSGGPTLNTRRSEPSTLMVINKQFYLVDAGAGTVEQLDKVGYLPNQISNVFITHHHLDHTAGLEPLMAHAWFLGNVGAAGVNFYKRPRIDIYGPPQTRSLVNSAIDYINISANLFNSGHVGAGKYKMPASVFKAHDIEVESGSPKVFYDKGGIRVTAVENTHFHFSKGSEPYRKHAESLSYRFDTPYGDVVFTGDTGPSKMLTKLAKNADVLVSQVLNLPAIKRSMHKGGQLSQSQKKLMWHFEHELLSPAEVGKMAQAAHVKMVILNHVSSSQGKYVNSTNIIAYVKKYYDGPVILSHDLMEYDVFK